jgi:transposase
VKNETSLDVTHETESISALFKLNDIHKANGVSVIRSDLSIDLDTTLHANLLAFLSRQGVLEAITKNNGKRETLTKLVRTRRWTRRPNAHHLSEVPMLGSMETLQVLLGTASPVIIHNKVSKGEA